MGKIKFRIPRKLKKAYKQWETEVYPSHFNQARQRALDNFNSKFTIHRGETSQ